MTMNKPMLALLLSIAFAPALAGEGGADQPITRSPDGSVTLRFDTMITGRDGTSILKLNPVKNAPYSAQSVIERTQTLGDGNQISNQRAPATYYRDSAGRTRQEIRDDKGDIRTVTISDPVAGVTWVLKPEERTAIKLPKGGRHGLESREGKLPRIERRKSADGSEEIIVKRIQRADGEAGRRMGDSVRIHLATVLDANGAALRDMPGRLGPLASAFGDAKWAARATTKDLGTRDFNGVKAEGKLRSYEIPAGEIGNRNPIVVSDETWTAPELKLTVYTRHSDPRSGEAVFRLENLKREEPAATLFSVPSDYTVKEALKEAPARAQ